MRKRGMTPTRVAAPVFAEARLRPRYQLTLPDSVAAALAAAPDDRLVFEADPREPGVVRLRKARTTWAGALAGVFGSEEEFAAVVREERASWAADE
jgi:bifunctional DNA-binding transcriptional regulator/antitoxin component of YhaV-PrlF toxin-antitoxin module